MSGVDFNGVARAVGKSALYHNLYPKAAVLVAGEPLQIKTRKVNMQTRSLAWLMDTLQGLPQVYLMGELWIDAAQAPTVEDLELYHPVTWSGERGRLHYARPADLANFRRLVAIRGEVMVQGWGESGVAAGGEGRQGGGAEGVAGVVLGHQPLFI